MKTIEGYDVKIFTDNMKILLLNRSVSCCLLMYSVNARFALCQMYMPEQDVL